jgi:LysM repeat protein
MENNEINPKPQPTGGLKLMTVFIAVLALHVVVIGGITIYYMVNGGSTDADLVTDKTHKSVKVVADGAAPADSTSPDGTTPSDKNAAGATTVAETSSVPMTIPAPTPDANAPAPSAASTPAPSPAAPASQPSTPAPAAPPAETASAPSGPVTTGSATTAAAPDASSEMAGGDADAPAVEPPSTGGISYTVKSHDSLARIAHRHHLSVAELRSANDLKSDLLQIGQKLTIPEKTATATAPTQKATKTKSLAALRDPSAPLLGDSDAATPVPKTDKKKSHKAPREPIVSDTPAKSPKSHHSYTVTKGDTLIKIAHKFHTSPSAIMAANNLSDSHKMKVGQKLRIPSQESRSANIEPAPVASPVALPVTPQAQPEQTQEIEPRATPSSQLATFPSSM